MMSSFAHSGLSSKTPTENGEAHDAFVSDPRKPVPYTAEITTTEGHLFMVEDQRFVWGRSDVLVYQTPPLTDDFPHRLVPTPTRPSLSDPRYGIDHLVAERFQRVIDSTRSVRTAACAQSRRCMSVSTARCRR